jgi:hypothetical protein
MSVRTRPLEPEQIIAQLAPPDRLDTWARRSHWAIALAGYALLTVAITFPLVLHLGDSIAGPYATEDSLWYTWYPYAFRTSLAAGQDPATTHLLYALLPNIQLFAASDVNGAAGALLLSFMAPLAVFNALLLANFALSGLAAYLLASEFVHSRWAAFVAGCMYTYSTYHFWRVISGLSLTSMQYMPLAAWRVFAFYRRPTWRNAILMGLALALMPLSDLYLSAYFLPPFALLFLAGLLVARRDWLADRMNVLRAAAGLAVTAVIALPLLVSTLNQSPAIRAAIAQPTIRGRPTTAMASLLKFSGNVIAYLLPHPENPFFGSLTRRWYAGLPNSTIPESGEYLGWIALLLAVFGLIVTRKRPRAMYFWLALGFCAFFLSLGPELQVGHYGLVALPFYGWLYNWSIFAGFRAPQRMAPVVLLSVCMLAAFGLAALLARLRTVLDAHPAIPPRVRLAALPALCALLIAGSLAENIQFGFPYPFTHIAIPPLYQQMADEPVPGLVLTLPIYPHGSDMFYQTIHHRGLVTGYPIRTTYPMIRTFENIPGVSLFDWPDTFMTGDPIADDQGFLHDIFPQQETLLQGLQANHIRYVVLRADTTGAAGVAFPPIEPWMRPYLEQALGAPFYDSSAFGVTAWRIPQVATAPNLTHFVMGDGWMPGLQIADNQMTRRILQDAELDVYLPKTLTTDLSLAAMAVSMPRSMVVSVNGSVAKVVDFTSPGVLQTVDIGTVTLHAGENVLHFASTQQCVDLAANYPPTLDPTCLAFHVSSIQMTGF